jgi:nicotinate-nucleotide pyrophosphorylase (carboxylating)
MPSTPALERAVDHLIELALAEDMAGGDVTTEALVPPGAEGRAVVLAKEPLVLAGAWVAERVFRRLDPDARCRVCFGEGERVAAGAILLEVHSRLPPLLMGERTALNFLQRLSGIATQVRAFVDRLPAGCRTRLVDTRKTIPGWRLLEKYAVRMGGAVNHRLSLSDGVLIKDNHIAACGGIATAVTRAREAISHLFKIEVEVSDLAGVREALSAGADVIMLDNMEADGIRAAVALIAGRALVEISGGVGAGNFAALLDTGADIVSVGALTHAARSMDISLRIIAT